MFERSWDDQADWSHFLLFWMPRRVVILEKERFPSVAYQLNSDLQIGMANKITAEAFKHLRVYQRLTVPLLLNDILCNRIMKFTYLVDQAPTFYANASRLFGKRLVNAIVSATYCKVFTAGSSIPEVNETSNYFRSQGVPVILDYCAEGDITRPDLDKTLDQNTALFVESARVSSQHSNEMISIKMTGLLDMRVLRKLNEAVESRDNFWRINSEEGRLTYSGLLRGIKAIKSDVTQTEVIEYLASIHGHTSNPIEFQVDELTFKSNHQPFFVFDHHKNSNSIIRQLSSFGKEDRAKLEDFIRRLKSICEPFAENQKNFRILVDAEQSYVQKAIESVSEQLQERYNHTRTYIIPTIQNYLKRSVDRGMYQIRLAKHKNLRFAAKLVRGAYIVEETRLARQNGYENPVVDDFDSTTLNYLTNFQNILQHVQEGQVVVATHNRDTIEEALKIKQRYAGGPIVSFAQLLGLADHLTWQLRQMKLPVYKYLPWAQTEVMVPYMIRRAQELNQMKYPLDIQYELLKHELRTRFGLS